MRTIILSLVSVLLLAACSNSAKKEQKASDISLTAAGATFPLPFYNLVFKNYTDATGVQITYGGVGSGGGIRSLTDKVVDFGATDAYLEDDKLAEMPAEVLHIPTCLGAVVIAYNLPGVAELKLSDVLLEKIFMGEIAQWDDAAIKTNNPNINLPSTKITVVTRSDGSGTTHIFSDYMSKISTVWAEKVGTGKSLQFPVGIGAKGNPGVAGTIAQTEGSIGYIGSEFAFAQKIQTAKIQNSSGNYVEPTIESISASAQAEIPADTRVMLTNSADPNAYPISGFTWLIFYKEQAYNNRGEQQARQTIELMDWMMSAAAQDEAAKVHYAPLPQSAVEKAKAILRTVTYNGEPILK